jgi:hypothetical protein
MYSNNYAYAAASGNVTIFHKKGEEAMQLDAAQPLFGLQIRWIWLF